MNALLPTPENIETLIAYLPALEAPGFEPVQGYGGGTVDAADCMTASWPIYDPLVREFMHAAAQPCWCDYAYKPVESGAMLRCPEVIDRADLLQIKTMLTYCVRGERFCDGLWGGVVGNGTVQRLLRRLDELRVAGDWAVLEFLDPRDEHTGYLSNFYHAEMPLAGAVWPTVEHYYQAMKFDNPLYREQIHQAPTARAAKQLGQTREQPLRPDWEECKRRIMLEALVSKFMVGDPDLRRRLLATGNALLVEANAHDNYWGMGDGKGQNQLGRLLMAVRAVLAAVEAAWTQETAFCEVSRQLGWVNP